MNVVSNGMKVRIVVSEPWDTNLVITGEIVRSLNSEEYYIIMEDKCNKLYVVASRYVGVRLSDLLRRTIIIGIFIPSPWLNVLTIPEITPEDYKLLEYKYIGSMSIKRRFEIFNNIG
jgi:hypothetical protein